MRVSRHGISEGYAACLPAEDTAVWVVCEQDPEQLVRQIDAHKRDRQARLAQARAAHEYSELLDCTFTPAITRKVPQSTGPVVVRGLERYMELQVGLLAVYCSGLCSTVHRGMCPTIHCCAKLCCAALCCAVLCLLYCAVWSHAELFVKQQKLGCNSVSVASLLCGAQGLVTASLKV